MAPLSTESADEHNGGPGGYASLSVEEVRAQNKRKTANQDQYNDDNPLGNMLDKYPDIQVCVDLGCGLGWSAALMAETRKKVYAIEPNLAPIRIAKEIYADVDNIEWIKGFAEDELNSIELTEPTLFNSSCVLSHLEDFVVKPVCQKIDQQAPVGSVLAFSELWGNERHSRLWHTRSKEWWKNVLSTFTLDFIERPCSGGFKSFTGVKL